MGRIMAIDYGTRRVGIAVTDPLQIIASPINTISPSELISFIQQYNTANALESIVVGYPVKEDGSPTHVTKDVEQLMINLGKNFPGIRIISHDERYTSRMALESMLVSGAKQKARRKKSNIDQISATLILQSYLQENSFKP